MGPDALGTSEMSTSAQNMKMGLDVHDTAENEFGNTKHENGTGRPSTLLQKSSGAQNMKTGPDALDTAENEFGSAKHEKGT
jgi:hypothetical protein